MLRKALIGRAMFEDYEQVENSEKNVKSNIGRMKENFNHNKILLDSANERLHSLETELKKY